MMEKNIENLYLENQLCFPLYAASRLTTKIYTPYLEELDITYPQYLVLLVLWQYKEQSVSNIGQKLLLESNTLTPLLKRLEQKKLILRKRSVKDERTVLISLTKEGKTLKEKAKCIPENILKSFKTEAISLTEAIEFQKTLLKLLEGLKEKQQTKTSI